MLPTRHPFVLALIAVAAACGGGEPPDSLDATASVVDCSTTTTLVETAACQANRMLATLSSTERAAANPPLTDTVARTRWSHATTINAPRAGVRMSSLGAAGQAAAFALMAAVLADTTDLDGILAADDHLMALSGSGAYGRGLYTIAIAGAPSPTGDWALMFGGHHLAYNVTFTGGVAYPTPNLVAIEPKAPFLDQDVTYQPLETEALAVRAIFDALLPGELATARLSESVPDLVVGPVEYGTGSAASARAAFPAGASRDGLLVSSLSASQRARVTAAITAWVGDYHPSIASRLLAEYTSSAAYQDTYVAWAGAGDHPDVDIAGTYLRIDGPRVWIEVSCQEGAVVLGATHYHTIYRDKRFDYGGAL